MEMSLCGVAGCLTSLWALFGLASHGYWAESWGSGVYSTEEGDGVEREWKNASFPGGSKLETG